LTAHLSADRRYGCWLLTLCGVRRSEVMALRWTDVDLHQRTLTITRGRVLIDGSHTLEDTPELVAQLVDRRVCYEN